MDAPPPPLLDTLPRLGVFSSLERRVLGILPRVYSLTPTSKFQKSAALSKLPAFDSERPSLALQGQWRLEGG